MILNRDQQKSVAEILCSGKGPECDRNWKKIDSYVENFQIRDYLFFYLLAI